MKGWKLWIAALAQAGTAAGAQADPLETGRSLAKMFLAGDVAKIWASSTPEMQQAFGSVVDLAALHDRLLTEFGSETAILSETATHRAGLDVFTRVARWTDAPGPLQLIIVFDGSETIAGFFVRPQPVAAPSAYLEYHTKARLRLPVRGEWFVYWGGRRVEDNHHAVDVAQRFAVDLLVLRQEQSHAGNPASLASYHCWGRPILAPAAGVVLRAVDGLPDQAIGTRDPSNPAGNHVVIDFGQSEYGVLAHLRQGSLSVAEGDPVSSGQMIGRCGNSGNSSEPHLHFHLQTSPRLDQGEGLPAQFTDYIANGAAVTRAELAQGDFVRPE